MTFKRFLCLALVCLMAISICACSADVATNDNSKYTVGICQLVPHPALDAATQGFIDALSAELGADNVTFLSENAANDPAVCTTIITNFINKNVNLIMANATPALQAAVNGTDTIPVLGTSITEYGTALGIDNFNGVVGGNVSGTSDLAPLDGQVDVILEVFPETKSVAILYCSAEANSEYQVNVVSSILADKNIECKKFAFADSNDVSSVAAAAALAADVIYIPTDNTAASCAETIDGVIGNTPCVVGESGVCCGAVTLSIDYYDLGVATGKMAARVLRDEADISEMNIEYAGSPTKMYNPDKCAQLGLDTAMLEGMGYVAIEK